MRLMIGNQFDHDLSRAPLVLFAPDRAEGLRRARAHGVRTSKSSDPRGSLRIYAAHAHVAEVRPSVAPSKRASSSSDSTASTPTSASLSRCADQTLAPAVPHPREEEGKRVVGYGAPAKGNTLLNYCGVRTDLLDFTVDRNPHKQGLFLPARASPFTRRRR